MTKAEQGKCSSLKQVLKQVVCYSEFEGTLKAHTGSFVGPALFSGYGQGMEVCSECAFASVTLSTRILKRGKKKNNLVLPSAAPISCVCVVP